MRHPVRLHPARARRRDVAVAAACGIFVAAMVGMAYASVPLYSWFCPATRFGGTTQVAKAAPGAMLERKLNARFPPNVTGAPPLQFAPAQNSAAAKLRQPVTRLFS